MTLPKMQLAVLQTLLKHRRSMYGLEIVYASKGTPEEIGKGTVYVTAARLEKAGHLSSHYRVPTHGNGRCRYYELTEKGERFLHAMRALQKTQ